MDVVVVGAGIVGASVAHHLSAVGARVTLLDRGRVASGATRASFGWIGAGGSGPPALTPLRTAALEDHRRLEREVPGYAVRWTGSLQHGAAPAWAVDAAAGPGARFVAREEVERREPALRTPPERALWSPGDGVLDPVAATEALVAAARVAGARVLTGVGVVGLRRRAGRVDGVVTTTGEEPPGPADSVVLAAGTGTADLLRGAGVPWPVVGSPAGLLVADGPEGLVRGVVEGPALEVRSDGSRLLVPFEVLDGSADALAARARVGVDAVRTSFTGAGDVRFREVRVGDRPMPPDGLPVVGALAGPRARGLHVAVLHSGVTLAPVVGRLVAAELTGREALELAGFRPARFAAPPGPVAPRVD